VVFQVSVTDESRQEATKSFQLSVDLCADGDVVECFAPTAGESCGHGTATCSGGSPGACQVASSSTSADCVFRSMAITDSGPWRSLVPVEGDHRFRSMAIAERLTRSRPA
jgi:hypothetical protein